MFQIQLECADETIAEEIRKNVEEIQGLMRQYSHQALGFTTETITFADVTLITAPVKLNEGDARLIIRPTATATLHDGGALWRQVITIAYWTAMHEAVFDTLLTLAPLDTVAVGLPIKEPKWLSVAELMHRIKSGLL